MNLFLSNFRIMLCGAYNCIDTNRFALFAVFYSHLSLSVWSWQSSVFTNFCKLTCKFMSHVDCIWHILLCLIRSISEHHTLISGTDCINLIFTHFSFQSFVYTHCDICRLLINCSDNCTCVCIKAIFATGITDFSYSISYDFLDINVSTCSNLTHYKYKTGCS